MITSQRMLFFKYWFFTFGLIAGGIIPGFTQEWELAKEGEGVKVFTKVSPTSGVKDAKAFVTIDNTRLEDAFNYFTRFDSHREWLYRVSESKILEKVSDVIYIVYYRASAPWPVADRDVVLRYEIKRELGKISIASTVLPDYIPEAKNAVRIREAGSLWVLEENKTGGLDVQYLNHANPGGSLPVWMANLAATSIPYKSLLSMKNNLQGK